MVRIFCRLLLVQNPVRVGGCCSLHHLDNYGSFYWWALKGESVIINMSHWHLGKACNTHMRSTYSNTHINTENQTRILET